MRCLALCLISVSLAGCSTMREQQPQQQHVVAPATEAQQSALLSRVKSLEGSWTVDGASAPDNLVTYQVTSKGSAVREVMFPGSDHEMTNMYTMDGPALLMTHYCAMGNQPHMTASSCVNNQIVFHTSGVSNLTAADQPYMGEMTITFIDADHIRQTWKSLVKGKPAEDHAEFVLTRKK